MKNTNKANYFNSIHRANQRLMNATLSPRTSGFKRTMNAGGVPTPPASATIDRAPIMTTIYTKRSTLKAVFHRQVDMIVFCPTPCIAHREPQGIFKRVTTDLDSNPHDTISN